MKVTYQFSGIKQTVVGFLFFFLTLVHPQIFAQGYTLTESDVEMNGDTIIRYLNDTAKDIIIPEIIGTKTVKCIGSSAFQSKWLTKISLPSSLVKIDNYAFWYNSFQKLIIPDGVMQIGHLAFMSNQIDSLALPPGITYLGLAAFNGNKIIWLNGSGTNGLFYKYANDGTIDSTTIVSYGGASKNIDFIPETVKYIEEYAFECCFLESVIIPNSVVSIGDFAFQINSLSEVTLSQNLSYLGNQAFSNNNLLSVTIPDKITAIGEYTFVSNKISSVSFPVNLTSIGVQAFANNELISLVIPNSVSTIGEAAFANNKLTEISLSNNITSIEQATFMDNAISELNFSPESKVSEIKYSAFQNNAITSLNLPPSISGIYEFAFSNNTIDTLLLPANLTYISVEAFSSNRLSHVKFENDSKIFAILHDAFSSNPELNYIKMPNVSNYRVTWGDTSWETVISEGDSIKDFTITYTANIMPDTFTVSGKVIGTDDVQLRFAGSRPAQFLNINDNEDFLFKTFYNDSVIIIPSKTGYVFNPDKIVVPHITDSLTGLNFIAILSSANNVGTEFFKIYPNPASDRTTIELIGENSFVSFELTDIMGKSIYYQALNDEKKYTLDLTSLCPGIYFVKLTDGKRQTINQKFIKK